MLTGVKATLASLGGCAGLDPGCAPWSSKMWAMDAGASGGGSGHWVQLGIQVVRTVCSQ